MEEVMERANPSLKLQFPICLFLGLLLVFASTITAMAQFTTARLSGTVTDSSGSAIPGAMLVVKSPDTGYTQNAISGAGGVYLFPSLPVGTYRLSVTMAGFAEYVQDGLTLTVNQSATQNISLNVGNVVQEVTVNADASLVTTESAEVGQLVNTESIVALPLNGREVQQLVFLIPGAVNVSSQNCGSNCEGGVIPGEQYAKINGGGSNGVYYLLDGVDYNDTYINTNMPFPSPDALEEFNVQTTNMSAVYGNATGGVVNVLTKSGSDQIHGDAFEFLRNYDMDARNYFASSPDPLKQNQFGGTVGGPILHHKLFYFGSYQGTRTNTSQNGLVAFVPTQAERSGDFSDILPSIQLVDPVTGVPFLGNQVSLGRLSSVAEYVLQHIPLPNGPGRQLTYNGVPTVANTNEYLGKLDYNFGKHHLSGHYLQTDYTVPLVSASSADQNLLKTNTNNPQNLSVKNISVVDIYTISNKFLLNSYFGYTSENGTTLSPVPFTMADAGSLVAQPVNKGNGNGPTLSLSVGGGFGVYNVPYGVWNHGDQSLREVATDLKGHHELQFGGEWLRVRLPMGHTYLENGSFGFTNSLSGDNTADFLLGQLSSFQQGGGYYLDFTGTNWSAFVQDNWKATSRLTISGGLRWDPYLPYTDSLGRVACFVPGAQSTRYPNAPVGLLFGGTNHDAGCPNSSIYNSPYNFGPRVGFATQLTADGKTSLRGGAGYYYEQENTVALQDIVGIPPFSPTVSLTDVNLTDPYGSAGVQNPFPASFGPSTPPSTATFPPDIYFYSIFDRHFRLPQILTWNLTLERGLGEHWLIRAAYMGNKADRLTGTGDQEDGMLQLNPAIYIPGASTEANTQQRRVYPAFGLVNSINSGVNSNYHSLQLSLEKHLTHGLYFLINFTWSKSLNDFGPAGGSGTNTCTCGRHFDYGPDTGDVNKIIRFSGSYSLPKVPLPKTVSSVINGWELSGTTNWHTGFPFTIFSNQDNSFSGIGADRASLAVSSISDAILSTGRPHSQLISEWFNTSAFTSNPIGTFGNTGKNILRGPRYADTDLALLKNTKLHDTVSLQFRAEFYNSLNNVNFGMPDGGLLDSGFGQITSAQSPRILQLALKLLF
jgi:hypothetical protein